MKIFFYFEFFGDNHPPTRHPYIVQSDKIRSLYRALIVPN